MSIDRFVFFQEAEREGERGVAAELSLTSAGVTPASASARLMHSATPSPVGLGSVM